MKYSFIMIKILMIALLIIVNSEIFSNQKSNGDIYALKLEDKVITSIIRDYIVRGVEMALENNAECVIIEMDTPGGTLESTRDIVKELLKDDIPIITYVSPPGSRAASAGLFITIASNIAVMAPGTHMGSAHPVFDMKGGGEKEETEKDKKKNDKENSKDGMFDSFTIVFQNDETSDKRNKKPYETDNKKIMMQKVVNDTISWVKNISKIRNRNAEWCVKAVVESASETEEFLLNNNVIDYIADDIYDLLEQIDGKVVKLHDKEIVLSTKDKKIKYVETTFKEDILSILMDPRLVSILTMIGIMAILYDIISGVSGIGIGLGLISLLLALPGYDVLPINYAGVALIVLAIIFFVLEIKVTSFGLLSIGGTISMVAGLLMLYDQPESLFILPTSFVITIAGSMAIIGGIIIYSLMKVVRKRPKGKSDTINIIGQTGYAVSDFDKGGKVFISGEYWTAESNDKILKDDKIVVNDISGFRLHVSKGNKEE